jgi:hypothetical protein
LLNFLIRKLKASGKNAKNNLMSVSSVILTIVMDLNKVSHTFFADVHISCVARVRSCQNALNASAIVIATSLSIYDTVRE